jgi:hypothetical protein
MFGSEILDVTIGTIFIYIVVSMICSAIREGIEALLKTRAAYLERGICELLHDRQAAGIVKSLYNHPLIYGLFSGEYNPTPVKRSSIFARGGNLPSYIPARNFALALMDLAARGPETDAVSSHPNAPTISLENIRMNVGNLKNEPVQRLLLAAIDAAQGDVNTLRKSIEDWYNSSMDRISGWYKRSTQWILFGIGIVVAVAVNVNSITIPDYLYRNNAARAAMVARAQNAAADSAFLNRNYDEVNMELNSINLPIGWTAGWGAPRRSGEPAAQGTWNNVVAPILGWLLTAFAASMGAPFWFDVLNKVMVIRSTVKPHEQSPGGASGDQQPQLTGTLQMRSPAAAAASAAPTPGPGSSPTSRDDQSSVDACGIAVVNATSDEELPAAEGGVA